MVEKCIQYALMFEERLYFAEILISAASCLNKRQRSFFPFAALPLEYQFQEKENINKKPVIYWEIQKLIGIPLTCCFQIFSYTYFST